MITELLSTPDGHICDLSLLLFFYIDYLCLPVTIIREAQKKQLYLLYDARRWGLTNSDFIERVTKYDDWTIDYYVKNW